MFGRCDKLGDRFFNIVNFLMYFLMFFIITTIVVVWSCFGRFELLELPVILFNGVINGISGKILALGGIVLGGIPLILCFVCFYFFKRFHRDIKREVPLWIMRLYLFLLFVCGLYACKSMLNVEIKFHLYCFFVLACLLIQGRDFRKSNQLFTVLLFWFGLVFFIYVNEAFIAPDYERYYVEDIRDLKMDKKRNIIVVFAESFEKKFSQIQVGDSVLKVKDDDAVCFSDFMEGREQKITIDALVAALSGAYHRYGNNYKKYFASKKAIEGLADSDYEMPLESLSVGSILKQNGYVNMFIKGADITFMRTDDVLLKNGFLKENIYDQKSFDWWDEFIEKKKTTWWGPSDNYVMDKFKEKILELDKDKPFFAVMFTCDLHAKMGDLYKNPFFDSDEEIIKSTINNINEFVDWFKKQEWYENTTLVVLADHRKMDRRNKKEKEKEKLYNAFFNLPEDLKKDLNINRKFNQIDMAPTLLEIAGVKLKERRYGLGVSLFSKYETIAEKEL